MGGFGFRLLLSRLALEAKEAATAGLQLLGCSLFLFHPLPLFNFVLFLLLQLCFEVCFVLLFFLL